MITLRLYQPSDLDMVRAYVTDPEISRYLTWKPYTDQRDILTYIERIQQQTDYPDQTLVVVVDDTPIGTVHLLTKEQGGTLFGFGILPTYWGHGIGTELVGAILSFIESSNWNLYTTRAMVGLHEDNLRAQNVLLTHGFHLDTPFYEPHRHLYVLDRPFRTTEIA